MADVQLLTASRMACMLSCQRKHYWRYECRLQKSEVSLALRFGTAWHVAMEARWRGADYDAALAAGIGGADFDEVTLATLAAMLAGYFARYSDGCELASVEPEVEFDLPLDGSRLFRCGGKIDGLGYLQDGRGCMVEHKTTADSLDSDSDYWLRLRANSQVYQYVDAARALGREVAEVVYDVTRKPSIRQKQSETPAEFGERLRADCLARPDFYYARREVPILDDDLAEFRAQRLTLARQILAMRAGAKRCQRAEHGWPRNVTDMGCRMCEFAGPCLGGVRIDPLAPPAGFVVGERNHELSSGVGDGAGVNQ